MHEIHMAGSLIILVELNWLADEVTYERKAKNEKKEFTRQLTQLSKPPHN